MPVKYKVAYVSGIGFLSETTVHTTNRGNFPNLNQSPTEKDSEKVLHAPCGLFLRLSVISSC